MVLLGRLRRGEDGESDPIPGAKTGQNSHRCGVGSKVEEFRFVIEETQSSDSSILYTFLLKVSSPEERTSLGSEDTIPPTVLFLSYFVVG